MRPMERNVLILESEARQDIPVERTRPPAFQGSPLPFSNLSPDEFEVACFLLLRKEYPGDSIYYYGKTGDAGRDIIHKHANRTITLIQCKHYQSNIGVSVVQKELKKVIKNVQSGVILDLPDELVFFLTRDLTSDAIDWIQDDRNWIELLRQVREEAPEPPIRDLTGWRPALKHEPGIALSDRLRGTDLVEEFFTLRLVIDASLEDVRSVIDGRIRRLALQLSVSVFVVALIFGLILFTHAQLLSKLVEIVSRIENSTTNSSRIEDILISDGGRTESPLVNEQDAQYVLKHGDELQRALVLTALAAASPSPDEWARADDLIREVDLKFAANAYLSRTQRLSYHLLKGNREFFGGSPDPAIAWYRQALGLTQPGSFDPDVSNNLALALLDARFTSDRMADLDEAERLLRRTLKTNPEDRAVVLNNLACVIAMRGDLTEAERLHREALELRKREAPQSREVANSLNNLAHVLNLHNRFADAEQMYRDALAIRMKLWPTGSREVATTLANLVDILIKRDKVDEAEALSDQSLAMRLRLLGQDDPDVASGLNTQALVLMAKGCVSEAIPPLFEALKIQSKALGTDHPEVASTLNNIGIVHSKLGQFPLAEGYLWTALETRQRLFPAEHRSLAISLNNLADVLSEHDHCLDIARSMEEEALEMRRKLYPSPHPDVAESLTTLALLTAEEAYATEALQLRRDLFGEDSVEVARTLNRFGHNLLKRDNEKAERYCTQALSMYERLHLDNSEDAVSALTNKAFSLQYREKNDEAEPLFRRAFEIRSQRFGPDHRNTVQSRTNLTRHLHLMGKRAEWEAPRKNETKVASNDKPDPAPNRPDNDAIVIEDSSSRRLSQPSEPASVARVIDEPIHAIVSSSSNSNQASSAGESPVRQEVTLQKSTRDLLIVVSGIVVSPTQPWPYADPHYSWTGRKCSRFENGSWEHGCSLTSAIPGNRVGHERGVQLIVADSSGAVRTFDLVDRQIPDALNWYSFRQSRVVRRLQTDRDIKTVTFDTSDLDDRFVGCFRVQMFDGSGSQNMIDMEEYGAMPTPDVTTKESRNHGPELDLGFAEAERISPRHIGDFLLPVGISAVADSTPFTGTTNRTLKLDGYEPGDTVRLRVSGVFMFSSYDPVGGQGGGGGGFQDLIARYDHIRTAWPAVYPVGKRKRPDGNEIMARINLAIVGDNGAIDYNVRKKDAFVPLAEYLPYEPDPALLSATHTYEIEFKVPSSKSVSFLILDTNDFGGDTARNRLDNAGVFLISSLTR